MDDFWKKEAQFKTLFVRRELVELVQDLVVGVLLSQIVYWFKPSKEGKSKLSVEHDGKLWVAKHREEWAAECSITLKQYKRAIAILQELKLIEVRLFGFAGKVTPHVWLDVDAINCRLEAIGTKGANPLVPKGPVVGGHWALSAQSNTESTYKENTVIETQQAALKEQGEFMEEANKVLEGFKNKTIDVNDVKPSLGALGLLWKKRMALLYPKYAKPILSGKDMGQIKHFLKDLKGDAPEALDWVLQNWGKYCAQCTQMMGLPNTPAVPDIGFLTLHRQVLKAMMPFPKPAYLHTTTPLQSIAVDVFVPGDMPVVVCEPEEEIDVEESLAKFAPKKGK